MYKKARLTRDITLKNGTVYVENTVVSCLLPRADPVLQKVFVLVAVDDQPFEVENWDIEFLTQETKNDNSIV